MFFSTPRAAVHGLLHPWNRKRLGFSEFELFEYDLYVPLIALILLHFWCRSYHSIQDLCLTQYVLSLGMTKNLRFHVKLLIELRAQPVQLRKAACACVIIPVDRVLIPRPECQKTHEFQRPALKPILTRWSETHRCQLAVASRVPYKESRSLPKTPGRQFVFLLLQHTAPLWQGRGNAHA